MAADRLFVLTADTQDAAFGEVRRFGKALEAAGLGRLRHRGSEGQGRQEIFTWALDSGALQLRLVDDEDLPAMFVELSGDAALVGSATEAIAASFGIATPEQVVEATERESEDDPGLLHLAALAATPALRSRVLALLAQCLADTRVERRAVGARAAALLATPEARRLVEGLAAREVDATLARRLATLLARWSGDAG